MRVQLLSLDDQGDKATTQANVAQLTANPRVVALTGFTTRPCSEAGAVMAAQEGIAADCEQWKKVIAESKLRLEA